MKNQTYNKKLSDAQTAAMIKDTAKPPAKRRMLIEEVINRCNFSSDSRLNSFGIGFNEDVRKQGKINLKELQVRVVESPTVHYKVILPNP